MSTTGVRVLGRRDLAEQVHEVLCAAGASAEIFQRSPSTAGADLSATTSEVDVVVVTDGSGLDYCNVVKKASWSRPVAAVVMHGMEPNVANWAKSRFGPDASVIWPCTGEAIIEACGRARESSRTRRPRVRLSGSFISILVLMAIQVGALIGNYSHPDIFPTWINSVASSLMMILLSRHTAMGVKLLRIFGTMFLIMALAMMVLWLYRHTGPELPGRHVHGSTAT
jgi:hypothetical protein